VLEETYGVIVFQEQVLRVVHVFAGFSYAAADAFRRAMTKDRSYEEMARLKTQFMDRAIKRSLWVLQGPCSCLCAHNLSECLAQGPSPQGLLSRLAECRTRGLLSTLGNLE